MTNIQPKYDIIGQTFNRLTAISFAYVKNESRHWLCKCICGRQVTVSYANLIRGHTTSCGCYHREIIGITAALDGKLHGQSSYSTRTKEYIAWLAAKGRCYNPNSSKFSDYGARGIKMCDRWFSSFNNFFEDMGKAPTSKHSLDRIDTNGNYEPSNCRWADQKVQAVNKRSTVFYTIGSIRMCRVDLCKFIGICEGTLETYIRNGYTTEQIKTIFDDKRKSEAYNKRYKNKRILSIIVFIFLWLNCSSQDSPFVATWFTNNEIGVLSYEVQSSINKINWNILNTIPPKKKATNFYVVTLPRNPIWYRIAGNMEGNKIFITKTIKLDTTFNISSIKVKSRQVSFQSDNELDLKEYLILQSQNGYSYTIFQHLPAKGNSFYLSNSLANNQKYLRITVVFKNDTVKILNTIKL